MWKIANREKLIKISEVLGSNLVNIFNQMGVLTISLFEHKIKTIKPVSYKKTDGFYTDFKKRRNKINFFLGCFGKPKYLCLLSFQA